MAKLSLQSQFGSDIFVMMIDPALYIDDSNEKGRGVFTKAFIPANAVIEISPVIVMTSEERKLLDQTLLHDYIFEWGPDSKQCCVAFGYVSIYNHSYQSNCEYEMDFEKQLIRIKTIRSLHVGEELFINYNGNWNDSKPVWFAT